MNNKKVIGIVAICFSILFSGFYYVIFSTTITSSDKTSEKVEKKTLYMNQVGLYKQQESVKEMQDKLAKEKITSFTMKQKDLTAVVCSVSIDEKETKKEQAKLKELGLSYIQKNVTVENTEIVKLIEQKDFAKALERIGK